METPFDPRELAKNELAASAIRSFGDLRLRVSGSSMLPALRPDDFLLVRSCRGDEVGPGDIVLYIRQRRLFAHRVISRSGAQLVTRGDGMVQADLPVSADELLGKVVKVTRRGKDLRHAAKPALPTRMAAALFRRSASAGRLFLRLQDLRSRTRP